VLVRYILGTDTNSINFLWKTVINSIAQNCSSEIVIGTFSRLSRNLSMAIPYVVPRRSAKMDYSLPPTLFGIQGFEIQAQRSEEIAKQSEF
jgi:hypothetical protein